MLIRFCLKFYSFSFKALFLLVEKIFVLELFVCFRFRIKKNLLDCLIYFNLVFYLL